MNCIGSLGYLGNPDINLVTVLGAQPEVAALAALCWLSPASTHVPRLAVVLPLVASRSALALTVAVSAGTTCSRCHHLLHGNVHRPSRGGQH